MGLIMMNNSDSIFELEQQIMKCWEMTDDIRNAAEYIYDSPDFINMPGEYSDKIVNLLFGIEEVYKRRFEKCWGTFESVCKEYHRRGKMAQLDREEIFPDDNYYGGGQWLYTRLWKKLLLCFFFCVTLVVQL